MPNQRTHSNTAQDFETHASEVLTQMRMSLAKLIESSPEPIRRASDLQRAYRMGKTLSWQIHRVATAQCPLEAGTHVPKPAALQRFLAAAQSNGADPALLEETRHALDQFERLVKQHAGDRTAFDSMISHWAGDGAEQIDVAHRRALFRGNAHLFGMSASGIYQCVMCHPSAHSDTLDRLAIKGYYSLRRLRPDVPCSLGYSRLHFNNTTNPTDTRYEPLDQEGFDAHGGPIYTAYSSKNLPALSIAQRGPGFVETIINGSTVGNAASATYVMAEILRNVPHVDNEVDEKIQLNARLRVPAELCTIDVFIPRHLYKHTPLDTNIKLLADVAGRASSIGNDDSWQDSAMLLPLREEITYLGTAEDAMYCPQVPRYQQMIHDACTRLDWNLQDFDLYRFQMSFPVANTILVATFG